MIYTEQIPNLQKLIFNIRVRREVRNVADMMEFNWASILWWFYTGNAAQTKNMVDLPLSLQVLTFTSDKSIVWAKGNRYENIASDM